MDKKAENKEQRKPKFILAIDLGTWGTGFAYDSYVPNSKKAVYVHPMGKKTLFKARTDLLLDYSYLTHSFGEGAFESYLAKRASEEDVHFLRQFKMSLYNKGQLQPQKMLKTIEGKEIPSRLVIQRVLEHVFTLALDRISKALGAPISSSDILLVLTVPAIWSQAAKQLMRDAAREAKLFDAENQLIIALEPEAASLACRMEENAKYFLPGSQYLIIDAGGGTIDCVAHEVISATELKETLPPDGGPWGSTYADEKWIDTLETIFGTDLMSKIKRSAPDCIEELKREFEGYKVLLAESKSKITTLRVTIPRALDNILNDNDLTIPKLLSAYKGPLALKWEKRTSVLILPSQAAVDCFRSSLDEIIKFTQRRLKDIPECKTLFLVGGYAESDMLYNTVKDAFPSMTVIRPEHASATVLRGAVEFGRNPSIVTCRVMRYTIGIGTNEECSEEHKKAGRREIKYQVHGKPKIFCEVFFRLVQVGTTVRFGEQMKQTLNPIGDDQSSMSFTLYCSKEKDPRYCDSCETMGSLSVPMPVKDGGLTRKVNVFFTFGQTEIQVHAVDETSGESRSLVLDCLMAGS